MEKQPQLVDPKRLKYLVALDLGYRPKDVDVEFEFETDDTGQVRIQSVKVYEKPECLRA